MKVSEKFGENIRARRVELGVSLEELSRRSGVASSTIRHWEKKEFGRNGPRRQLVQDVAKALEMRVDEVTGVDDVNTFVDGRAVSNEELKQLIQAAFQKRLHVDGVEQKEVGAAFGVSKQAAHHRFRGDTVSIPLLLSTIERMGYKLEVQVSSKRPKDPPF